MTVEDYQGLLNIVLLNNGEMAYGLYEYELEEHLDQLIQSLIKDRDEFIFAITENSNHVAMVLIEKSGKVYVNELARDKLMELWKGDAYTYNMKKMIPDFAKQLHNGEMPVNGVKTIKGLSANQGRVISWANYLLKSLVGRGK